MVAAVENDGGGSTTLTAASEATITATVNDDGTITVGDPDTENGGATGTVDATLKDIVVTNGVVHVVDTVLQPSGQ